MKPKVRIFITTVAFVVVLDGAFDMAKWGLGRFTTIDVLTSFALIVAFSAILALALELLHRWRRTRGKRFIQYLHHGTMVWVREGWRGQHWEPTLCQDCQSYYPDTDHNCKIAEHLFYHCKENHLTLAVFECPEFKGGRLGKQK